ncbi:hypothetical protein VKT23_009943 [Stygiomarasmius scandens]|uniref:Uncharacterized protein n=1 Tax=Marasmiellus scandens TaxID=2682957 RepID=A0ABR1JDG5_9AGAR
MPDTSSAAVSAGTPISTADSSPLTDASQDTLMPDVSDTSSVPTIYPRDSASLPCYCELENTPSPQNSISNPISEILGQLPDLPNVYDFSLSSALMTLESRLDFELKTYGLPADDTVCQETQRLHEKWGLKQDFQTQRQSLERAVLATKINYIYDWSHTYSACLKAVLTAPALPPPSSGLDHYARLLATYGQSVWNRNAYDKVDFRSSLDSVTALLGGAKYRLCHKQQVFAAGIRNLGKTFKADQSVVRPLSLAEKLDQPQAMLLNWGTELPDESVDIPVLPQEFKGRDGRFDVVVNQIVVDLMSGAAINELLDIQFPLYGVVVSLDRCIVYAGRARAQSDGSLKFAVQKVEELGILREFTNYLKYLSFLVHHQIWFKANVWNLIQQRQHEDPNWVIHKLNRQQFKQWSVQYAGLSVCTLSLS